MADKRPMVTLYEPVGAPAHKQALVHREMNDAEYEDWKRLVAEAPPSPNAEEHPLLTQVKAMSDEERAILRELLK